MNHRYREKDRIWQPVPCPEVAEVFSGKGVLKICSKFTGEYPCQSVIEPLGTTWETDPHWKTFYPRLTRKDLLERSDLNQLIACFEKSILYNLCKSTPWSIVSKAVWRSIRIMLVITLLSKPLKILPSK